MPPTPAQSIFERPDVTPQIFREEILPGGRPVVMRGIVGEWPAVRAGRESPRALANYLRGFDTGAVADTMVAPPSIGGRFFYNDDLSGLNFERGPARIADSIERLIALLDDPAPPAVYVGAVPVPATLPGFARDNVLPLLDPACVARLWLGNRVTVQTHYDLSYNVACVIAGRRRFTLFPPEQLVNLYTGPLEFTLAGQPISMVRIESPDLDKFPRFPEAWAHAQAAELAPGDALFVPYMWWHHVDSLERFNVLVNYWWDDLPAWSGSPFEALLHGILSVRSLPPEKRAIWRAAFDHLVFQSNGDPVAHLTPRQQGIQGPQSPQLADLMRAHLVRTLSRRRG
jgi:hypothetical protein